MKTVLVLEDHVPTAYVLGRLLALAGFDPAVAHTGAEALALLKAVRPAAMVIDCHIPDISGIEVLRAARADPATSGVPAVVYSGDETDGCRAAAAALGVPYLPKSKMPPHAVVPVVAGL
ncbi:MAG TPA: response regulator, partial [Humisphaera sp.]